MIKRKQILMEINKYKHINVQTLQSQIQDSVENKEAQEETQGQDNHKSREASALVLLPLIELIGEPEVFW
jgi:excinuclease UvrABC helicase subunit UvrB